MDSLLPIDLATLIQTVGYLGIFLIVFADSGVLLGLVLPGDSLLFTAGLLASQGHLNLWLLMLVATLGAILGDSAGYAFGKRMGAQLFTRKDSGLRRYSDAPPAQLDGTRSPTRYRTKTAPWPAFH